MDLAKFNLDAIYTREDGSYVINNGLYHVPNEGQYAELWALVNAEAEAHPEKVQPEPSREPEPYVPTPEEQAQKQEAKAQSILLKPMMMSYAQTMSLSTEDMMTIAHAGYFPTWEASLDLEAGDRLYYEGSVYEVVQNHTSQAHQPPNAEGMLAIYRPLAADPDTGVENTGTLEDPIPYQYGMNVYNGKYYSYNGATYLAKADLIPCVWNPDTAGLWQWEAVSAE